MLDASVALTGPFRTAAAVPHHLVVGLEEVRSTFCSLLQCMPGEKPFTRLLQSFAFLRAAAQSSSPAMLLSPMAATRAERAFIGVSRAQSKRCPCGGEQQSRAGRSGGWVGIDAGGETERAVLSHMCLGLGPGLGIAHRKLR